MEFSEESKKSIVKLLSTLNTVNAVDNGDETTTMTFVFNTDPLQEFSTLIPVSIATLFEDAFLKRNSLGVSPETSVGRSRWLRGLSAVRNLFR